MASSPLGFAKVRSSGNLAKRKHSVLSACLYRRGTQTDGGIGYKSVFPRV